MRVTTESGTLYEITATHATRWVYGSGEMRRDGERLGLLSATVPVVGQPMVMILDLRGDGIPTLRTTSPVTAIV